MDACAPGYSDAMCVPVQHVHVQAEATLTTALTTPPSLVISNTALHISAPVQHQCDRHVVCLCGARMPANMVIHRWHCGWCRLFLPLSQLIDGQEKDLWLDLKDTKEQVSPHPCPTAPPPSSRNCNAAVCQLLVYHVLSNVPNVLPES